MGGDHEEPSHLAWKYKSDSVHRQERGDHGSHLRRKLDNDFGLSKAFFENENDWIKSSKAFLRKCF